MRYARDPYWTTARFASTDSAGHPIKKGERIFYYPATRSAYCAKCGEVEYRQFRSAVGDEEGIPYAS